MLEILISERRKIFNMKNVHIALLLVLMPFTAHASENETSKLRSYLSFNVSPVSLVLFGDDLKSANNDYGLSNQLIDIPFKRISASIYNTDSTAYLFGITFQSTYNRLNNKNVAVEIDEGRPLSKTSILTYQVGLSWQGYFNEIGKGWFLSMLWGFSYIDLTRGNFNKYHSSDSIGAFMQYGGGYSFKSNNKYSIQVGVDVLFNPSSLHRIDNDRYLVFSMSGIYPYVGFMW